MEMYECEQCAYATTNAADYSRHMTSHVTKQAATQRRASTDSSGSSGKLKSVLRRSTETLINESEIRTVSPSSGQYVNRYECQYCPYITRECVSIRRHVMSHINYYPYKCRYCEVSSIRSNAVKTHMANIHKDPDSSPVMVRDPKLEEKIHEGINKVYGDTPKRILKQNAGNYLLPLSQTMNAPSPFAKGNYARKTESIKQVKHEVKQEVVKEEPKITEVYDEDDDDDDTGNDVTQGTQHKGSKYVCKICKYVVYGYMQNIRRHVMIHFNYKKYKCPYCEFATIQSHGVTQHVMSAHPGQTPRYLTFSQADLEHKIQESIIKTGDFVMPSSNSASPPSATTTTTKSPSSKSFAAAAVAPPVAVPKSSATLAAVQSIAKKYSATLSTLSVIRSRKSQLGVSKKKKYDVDPAKIPPGRLLYYKCKICDFTENSSLRKCTNMRRHVMSHLDYKRYACGVCDFASTTTCMTKAHMRRKHPEHPPTYTDNKDDRLEKAMRANIIKVGGKPYTTYTYQHSDVTTPSDLTPTPERPFPRFSKQPKPIPMVDPEVRGMGNYQCLICNRFTLNGTTMKRHIASHFNYRRYGCPYCELLFTQSTFVLNHVRSKHVGSRLYYIDNKVPEMEEKIKGSWVNLKELEAQKGKIAVPQPQSKLKLLLTKKEGDIYDSTSLNPELSFADSGMEDSGEMNGDNTSDNSSVATIEYSDNASQPETIPYKVGSRHKRKNGEEFGGVSPNTTTTYYKCVRCTYRTEHKTSMLRHIMWKIGYKPYMCPHCGFQDVLVNGLRKHCARKHKGQSQTSLLRKDAEKEYEVEQLMAQSTIHPDNPLFHQLKSASNTTPPTPRATHPVSPPKKIKLEPKVNASPPKKTPVTKQLFDEPIDEKIIYRSQIKLQCQLCFKKSSSRGYIYNHVLRHGPPRLRCSYCGATMYFPKEAKTHSEHKHPGMPLNVKRLWGNRTWDHKNVGIERITAEEEISEPITTPSPRPSPEISRSRGVARTVATPGGGGGGLEDQGEEEVPPRLPKPQHVTVNEDDFEDTIIERTPVRIPRRSAVTGFYQCVYCEYSTANANHIKCHVLVHEPPHWRCDHCNKRFVMLYKLRKHTALVHGLPLRYTNLVTGETCIDSVVNYANAVLESPARAYASQQQRRTLPPVPKTSSTSPSSQYRKPAPIPITLNSGAGVVEQPVFPGGEMLMDYENQSTEEEGSQGTVEEDDTADDETVEEDDALILDCHACRFRTYSETEIAQHVAMEHNNGRELDGRVCHLQPNIVIADFLKLSIEDLHALMVEHGLEEIHQ